MALRRLIVAFTAGLLGAEPGGLVGIDRKPDGLDQTTMGWFRPVAVTYQERNL